MIQHFRHGGLEPHQMYTTQDEMDFLRQLYKNKKVTHLKNWLNNARNRVWHGRGMNVDAGACILFAEDLLAELKKGA